MEPGKPDRPRKSSRSRSHSCPRAGGSPLSRILSTQFPDDHSVYHHEDGEGIHVDEDTRSLHKTETERRDADPTKLDNHDHLNGAVDMEKTTGAEDSSISSAKERGEAAEPEGDNGYRVEKTYEEIRPGIPYQRDVEAPPVLKKTQSTRLMKDPNLVSNARQCKAIFQWLKEENANKRHR